MTVKNMLKLIIMLPLIMAMNAQAQNVVAEKMDILSSFVGDWNLEQSSYSERGAWEKSSTSKIAFKSALSGVVISGETRDMMPANAMNLRLSFTYDQFREIYRMSVIDSIYCLMDIYEGNINQDGHLMLTVRTRYAFQLTKPVIAAKTGPQCLTIS